MRLTTLTFSLKIYLLNSVIEPFLQTKSEKKMWNIIHSKMVLLYHFFLKVKCLLTYLKDHLIAKFSRIKPTMLAKKTDL